MASILTPSETPQPLPPSEDGRLASWRPASDGELDLTPHMLLQLEDDLERARMREAFWISVVVHLMVVILLAMSPKIFPALMKGYVLTTPEDLLKNQQMTYLDLPPDLQKAPKVPPKTSVLSDKNREAMSRHPSIDKKTLEELNAQARRRCRRRRHRSSNSRWRNNSSGPIRRLRNNSRRRRASSSRPSRTPYRSRTLACRRQIRAHPIFAP